jgi:hypothetical protein
MLGKYEADHLFRILIRLLQREIDCQYITLLTELILPLIREIHVVECFIIETQKLFSKMNTQIGMEKEYIQKK